METYAHDMIHPKLEDHLPAPPVPPIPPVASSSNVENTVHVIQEPPRSLLDSIKAGKSLKKVKTRPLESGIDFGKEIPSKSNPLIGALSSGLDKMRKAAIGTDDVEEILDNE
jgi:hypothetical protein